MTEPTGVVEHRYGTSQRIGLLSGPLLSAVLLATPPPGALEPAAWRTAAVGVLMAIWWLTEALPIPATSLLPLLLLPILGVAPVREAAAHYAHPLIYLFLGGFLIAAAMERWHLHRRIALNIIRAIGTRPTRIVAGFMVASAFLSMWISNTATAMMMLPIGVSVVELVRGRASEDDSDKATSFAVVLMLAIAYACSLGGLGTLIGTPTNALLAAFMEDSYGVEIAFLDWFVLALPLVVLSLAVTYAVLTRWTFPLNLGSIPGGSEYIAGELRSLGPISTAEKRVAAIFVMTALLWMTRPLVARGLPGLSDAGIAILGALLLFVIPVDWGGGQFLLDWQSARRVPWGVLLLFGGGLSLAAAIQKSGLATWIGESMARAGSWPMLAVTLLVVGIVILLTELTSNTATAAAFLPVLASIAVGIGEEPLRFLVPATLAASCAFMLPVATPPNAIVYGSRLLTIPQMARAGWRLNLIFAFLVTLFTYVMLPLVGFTTSTPPAP